MCSISWMLALLAAKSSGGLPALWCGVQVTGIFGSSVEVMISVHGETPSKGVVFHCGDAFATIVSVDLMGNPVSVPFELEPAG